VVAKTDNKNLALLNFMRHFLNTVPYPDKDLHVAHQPDNLLVGSGAQVLAGEENILTRF